MSSRARSPRAHRPGPLQPAGRRPGVLLREASAPCPPARGPASPDPRVLRALAPPGLPHALMCRAPSGREGTFLSRGAHSARPAGRAFVPLLAGVPCGRSHVRLPLAPSERRTQCDGWRDSKEKLTLCLPLPRLPSPRTPPLLLTLPHRDLPWRALSSLPICSGTLLPPPPRMSKENISARGWWGADLDTLPPPGAPLAGSQSGPNAPLRTCSPRPGIYPTGGQRKLLPAGGPGARPGSPLRPGTRICTEQASSTVCCGSAGGASDRKARLIRARALFMASAGRAGADPCGEGGVNSDGNSRWQAAGDSVQATAGPAPPPAGPGRRLRWASCRVGLPHPVPGAGTGLALPVCHDGPFAHTTAC